MCFGAASWGGTIDECASTRLIRSRARGTSTSKEGAHPTGVSRARVCRSLVGFASTYLVRASQVSYSFFRRVSFLTDS